MATASGGYLTNGLTLATIATVDANSVVNCDTQDPNGSAPQSLAVPLWLLSQFQNVNLGVTAQAGGGQTSATLLEYGYNTVTVVATNADSVKLPPSYAGAMVIIANDDAAQSTTVYGSGIDTVNNVATATGVSLAAGKTCIYIASATGTSSAAANWSTILTA
jgi:hypothetical protein